MKYKVIKLIYGIFFGLLIAALIFLCYQIVDGLVFKQNPQASNPLIFLLNILFIISTQNVKEQCLILAGDKSGYEDSSS